MAGYVIDGVQVEMSFRFVDKLQERTIRQHRRVVRTIASHGFNPSVIETISGIRSCDRPNS